MGSSRVPDARGVHQGRGDPVQIDGLGQQVTCGARHLVHDRAWRPEQPVEQRRLADVRLAEDDGLVALADEPSRARLGEDLPDAVPERTGLGSDGRRLDEMVTLLRKVERRLEPGNEVEERAVDLADQRRHGTFELVERDARL